MTWTFPHRLSAGYGHMAKAGMKTLCRMLGHAWKTDWNAGEVGIDTCDRCGETRCAECETPTPCNCSCDARWGR